MFYLTENRHWLYKLHFTFSKYLVSSIKVDEQTQNGTQTVCDQMARSFFNIFVNLQLQKFAW